MSFQHFAAAALIGLNVETMQPQVVAASQDREEVEEGLTEAQKALRSLVAHESCDQAMADRLMRVARSLKVVSCTISIADTDINAAAAA